MFECSEITPLITVIEKNGIPYIGIALVLVSGHYVKE